MNQQREPSAMPLHQADQARVRILVVDDDPGLRTFANTILSGAGFEVVEAANAQQASEICEQVDSHVQMVIADIMMPRESGRQLAARLLTSHPDIKILLMSGYPSVSDFLDDVASRSEGTRADCDFIRKPFSPEQLLNKVREILGG